MLIPMQQILGCGTLRPCLVNPSRIDMTPSSDSQGKACVHVWLTNCTSALLIDTTIDEFAEVVRHWEAGE